MHKGPLQFEGTRAARANQDSHQYRGRRSKNWTSWLFWMQTASLPNMIHSCGLHACVLLLRWVLADPGSGPLSLARSGLSNLRLACYTGRLLHEARQNRVYCYYDNGSHEEPHESGMVVAVAKQTVDLPTMLMMMAIMMRRRVTMVVFVMWRRASWRSCL